MIRRFFFCVCLIGLAGFFQVQAQHRHEETGRAPHGLEVIDQAWREGKITLDQKVLYQLYAIERPEALPEYLRSRLTYPLKCGTPARLEFRHYRSQLQPATRVKIELLEQPDRLMQAQEMYLSPSGRFRIHYATSGEDSVSTTDASGNGVPDYVDWVAAAADSSWRHEVQNLGYTDPILGPSQPYDIYVENLQTIYGETATVGGTTLIRLENDFSEGFPPNDDPQGNQRGALKATMAHELKHAIQYAATQWQGESDLWAEMDATLMEEVVYDNVNDYYNYLNTSQSIFNRPRSSLYPGSYYHVTWALYYHERFGSDFWVNVWEILQTDPQNIRLIEAMSTVLGEDVTFESTYVESQLWHYASGSARAPEDYGFDERQNYPNPNINTRFASVDSLVVPTRVSRLAAHYIELSPAAFVPGFIRITLIRSDPDIGVGLIAYLRDGSTEQSFLTGGEWFTIEEQTNWEWSQVDRLGIIIANSSESGSETFRIKITTDIPEQITLNQNYPNPFYPSTIIPFTLNRESQVELNVYDVLGRLVRTIIDDTLPAGFYDPEFQAGDLASGIYFYRLVTDDVVLTRQMTVIK